MADAHAASPGVGPFAVARDLLLPGSMSVFSSTDAPRRIVAISFGTPRRAEEALRAALRLEE